MLLIILRIYEKLSEALSFISSGGVEVRQWDLNMKIGGSNHLCVPVLWGGGQKPLRGGYTCLGNISVIYRTISENPEEIRLLVLKKILGQFRLIELHPIYTPLYRAEIINRFLTVYNNTIFSNRLLVQYNVLYLRDLLSTKEEKFMQIRKQNVLAVEDILQMKCNVYRKDRRAKVLVSVRQQQGFSMLEFLAN